MLMIWLKFSVSPRINIVVVCVLLLGMVVVRESVMMGLCMVFVLNLLVLFRVNVTYSSNGEVHSRRHVWWRI